MKTIKQEDLPKDVLNAIGTLIGYLGDCEDVGVDITLNIEEFKARAIFLLINLYKDGEKLYDTEE